MKVTKRLEPIKIKKLNIRGDEIAILFFSLLFLIFLLVSFFRLFAVGKLFDDFIFLFLFGWSKYIVYLTLFALTIPICFNYYFKLKLSFIFALSLSLIGISWLVSNINLILVNNRDLWLSFSAYNFNSLSNYFDSWWSSTIINNYHGFFGQPISFTDWTNVNSFFPSFAAGGIISNFLIAITNYGYFITNLILNLLLIIISFTWVFFNKPWLLFTTIFFFIKPLNNYFTKQKVKKISEKSILQEQIAFKTNNKLSDQPTKKDSSDKKVTEVKEVQVSTQTKLKPETKDKTKENAKEKQELLIQNVLKESGSLTPFGQMAKDPTQEVEINESQQEINN